MIVHDHRQVIGEQTIAAMNNKILARQQRVGLDIAAQHVMKLHHRTELFNPHGGIFRPMLQGSAMAVVNAADALNTRARAGAVIA